MTEIEPCPKELAARILRAFNGGLVHEDDPANPRGYTVRYNPVGAMQAALETTGVCIPEAWNMRSTPTAPSGDEVERVARALFDDHWQDDPGLIVSAWEDICDIEQDAWRRSAQAAIAAMRPASGELADDVELTIVAKRCVYLNDYRIAGGNYMFQKTCRSILSR